MNHSVPLAKPRSGQEIDTLALCIVQAFQPEALKMPMPFEVERFFDCELKVHTGVEPDYQPLGRGLLGYTSIEEMRCIISTTLADEAQDLVTKRILRATQAHEIGHCFLHVEEFRQAQSFLRFQHDEKHGLLKLHKQEEIKVFRNPEWQAWRFAGALLMPECSVRLAIKGRWSVPMMSRGFDVNPAFVRVRLDDLKIADIVRGR